MIEVRFFATLRGGRGKVTQIDAEKAVIAEDILRLFAIQPEEVSILLINGFHSKPGDFVKDGDVISLFPPVGGG